MKKTLLVRELLPRRLSSIAPRATSGNSASNRFRLARSITTQPYTLQHVFFQAALRCSRQRRKEVLLSFKQIRCCSARCVPKIQIIGLS